VAALAGLQAPAFTPGFRHHRGRLQDRLYAAAQAFGDVVDKRGWPSHLGPACDRVESRLGSCPSEVLGVKTDARQPKGHGQRRSTWATGGIGLWEWSDYTPPI
jgi:hypothetical protein